MSSKPRMALCALVAARLLIGPAGAESQETRSPGSFEVRGGFNWHEVGLCGPRKGSGSGGTLGLALRTQGTWFVSASADVFDLLASESTCELDLPTEDYQGQRVSVRGHANLDVTTPRVAAALGHRFHLGLMPVELTAGLGAVRTKIAYWGDLEEVGWRPWYGGTVTLFGLSPAVGVQFEWGRRRISERYYDSFGQTFVAEVTRWENMARLVFAYRP
jgi:hypothetical protein